MSTNQLEPNDLKGLCHWVHCVIMLAAARLEGSPLATICAVVQAFILDIQKKDQILKMARLLETALLPDFLENLPKNQKSQDEIWSAIKEALQL